MPSKWLVKARLALDQDVPLFFRRGLLIHLVKRAAAIEIFGFECTHLMPFAQRLKHRGRRLARHSGYLVFRVQTSDQGLAFRIGVQFDELAREHVLLEVDALRVPCPFNVLVFAASPCVARTCLAKLGKKRLKVCVPGNTPRHHGVENGRLQLAVRPGKHVALVATDHLRRVIEFSAPVVFRARQPEPVVGVFLKRLKESYLPIDQAERIEPLPSEQVHLRQHDMDVNLPLDRVTTSSIGVTL